MKKGFKIILVIITIILALYIYTGMEHNYTNTKLENKYYNLEDNYKNKDYDEDRLFMIQVFYPDSGLSLRNDSFYCNEEEVELEKYKWGTPARGLMDASSYKITLFECNEYYYLTHKSSNMMGYNHYIFGPYNITE